MLTAKAPLFQQWKESHPKEYAELFGDTRTVTLDGLFLDCFGSRLASPAFQTDDFTPLLDRLFIRFYPSWVATKKLMELCYDPLEPNSDTVTTTVTRTVNNEGSHNSQDTSSVCGYNDPNPTPSDVNNSDTSNTSRQNEESTTTTTHTSSIANAVPSEMVKAEIDFRQQGVIDRIFADISIYITLAVY